MSATETTIFVTTIGDRENFSDCMEHLQKQRVTRPIQIIDHVAPLSAAFQQMHERCRTEFYVQVDEDMMLFPHAVETLEGLLRQAGPDVALVCAPLWDCETSEAILGVKIYRHAIVKQFPYESCLGCETQQVARIRAAGWRVKILPLGDRSLCLGEHGKHYTPETIFKRWQHLFQKHQQIGQRTFIERWPQRLLDRYLVSHDVRDLYALLGAVAGIAGGPPGDRELQDWREPNAALMRLQRYFPTVTRASDDANRE